MNNLVKKRLWIKILSTAFGFSLLFPYASAEARRIAFNAPTGLKVPGRRVVGGSRSTLRCISENNTKLTALVPESNIGLTTSANPVLFFYVPQTSGSTLELVVQDEKQKFVKQYYKPSGNAGIVAIPLNKMNLEVGKQYRWFFTVVCNNRERSKDLVVDGAIKRIQPQQQLITQLKSATLQERANLYAQNGIWQDALASLAQLHSSRPNDPQFKADWKSLLTAEGVNLEQDSTQLVTEPLLSGNQAPQPISQPM